MRVVSQHGFTLIEIVVTLAIAAILLFAIVPSIKDWLDNTRIRTAAESLQNGIERARNEAVGRNETVSFWLVTTLDDDCESSHASPSWVVSLDSPAGDCGAAPSATDSPRLVVGRAAGADAQRLSIAAKRENGNAAASISFNGLGRPVRGQDERISWIDVTGTPAGTAYRTLRVTISPEGQVRLCDPKVSSDTDPRKC